VLSRLTVLGDAGLELANTGGDNQDGAIGLDNKNSELAWCREAGAVWLYLLVMCQ